MSKNLVIVESPAKAKTIARYLGSDFVVEASVGMSGICPDPPRVKPSRVSIWKTISNRPTR